jgi:nucleoside-diphosphate-sugar epimerase
MTQTVLILGASGKIGRHAAVAFAEAGFHVRLYDRKKGDMVRAAEGADVIINGLNPPAYHDWENLIPAITTEVIAAARASGATVIIPGNVYNLDARGGEWSEHTPHEPPTKKGRIREEMERAYRDAGVRTIILRAGNFIDPDQKDDVMKVLLLRDIARGRVIAAGDPSAKQAYCYVPDWARAAVGLAQRRQHLAPFEDVPFPGHTFTVNELRTHVARELGRPISISQFPWWLLSLCAPFWELAREMKEMRYLFSLSHSLSGEKISRLLPDFVPTPRPLVMSAGLPKAQLVQTALRSSVSGAA